MLSNDGSDRNTSDTNAIRGAVAGGQSRRFGNDKALVRIGEQALLEHMLAASERMPTAVIGRKVARDSWLGIPDRSRMPALQKRPAP